MTWGSWLARSRWLTWSFLTLTETYSIEAKVVNGQGYTAVGHHFKWHFIDDFLGVAGQVVGLGYGLVHWEDDLSITFDRDFLAVFVEEADFIGLMLVFA